MACDIHVIGEKKNSKGNWEQLFGSYDGGPLENRNYGVFGFLANVRNYSGIEPISKPRGLPEDADKKTKEYFKSRRVDIHSISWLSMAELNQFDYDEPTEDRRCMKNGNGGCTCEHGEGKSMTYREFLGKLFFKDLEELDKEGVERIVFGFDN